MDARGVSDDVEPLTGARVVREQSVPMHHSLSRPEVLHVSQLERVVRLARHHIGSSLRVSHVHPITSFLSRVVNLRAARSRVVPVRDVVKILSSSPRGGGPSVKREIGARDCNRPRTACDAVSRDFYAEGAQRPITSSTLAALEVPPG